MLRVTGITEKKETNIIPSSHTPAKPIQMEKQYSLIFNLTDPVVNSPPTAWKLRLSQRLYNS